MITPAQKKVLDAIKDLTERNGCNPSFQEIADECGLSSLATVHKHVLALTSNGYISRLANRNRTIEVIEPKERANRRITIEIPVELLQSIITVLYCEGLGERVNFSGQTTIDMQGIQLKEKS